MSDLNILVVEGNIPEDTELFVRAAGASASDNIKNLVLKLEPSANIKIINPDRDKETMMVLNNMGNYDGIIFTGGAMRINDMTDIIKKHINFASNCFKHDNKILAICWGLQVCSTAAGGKVAPGKNGAHIGIASGVEIHEEGKKNLIYKNKQIKFNTPAYNFDEVCKIPNGATLLSSDKVNKVMGLYFKVENSEIWGLQYHPDYEYQQMIGLAHERKDIMITNKNFESEKVFEDHMNYISEEDKKLDFDNRTCEVKNWLNIIKN